MAREKRIPIHWALTSNSTHRAACNEVWTRAAIGDNFASYEHITCLRCAILATINKQEKEAALCQE